MNETIDIPIIYKGKELIFKAKVVKFGYIHRFEVKVNGHSVIFEPDEERNYRVILNPVDDKNSKIDLALLKQISETLQSLS